MDARTTKQQRADAIGEALSSSDAMDEADEVRDMESFARRFEAKVSQSRSRRHDGVE
jgi:hypothetical protein